MCTNFPLVFGCVIAFLLGGTFAYFFLVVQYSCIVVAKVHSKFKKDLSNVTWINLAWTNKELTIVVWTVINWPIPYKICIILNAKCCQDLINKLGLSCAKLSLALEEETRVS